MENNKKSKVYIKIAGSQLTLLTDEPQSFVDSVTTRVNERLSELTRHSYHVNRADAALLCCVDLCGNCLKAEKRVRNLEAQISLYDVNFRRLRTEIVALKRKAGLPLDGADVSFLRQLEYETRERAARLAKARGIVDAGAPDENERKESRELNGETAPAAAEKPDGGVLAPNGSGGKSAAPAFASTASADPKDSNEAPSVRPTGRSSGRNPAGRPSKSKKKTHATSAAHAGPEKTPASAAHAGSEKATASAAHAEAEKTNAPARSGSSNSRSTRGRKGKGRSSVDAMLERVPSSTSGNTESKVPTLERYLKDQKKQEEAGQPRSDKIKHIESLLRGE